MKAGRVGKIIGLPVFDTVRGLESSLVAGPRALALVFLGLLVGWWIYVPCHELLHVAGCVATGGAVSRLEIDSLYGGRFLAKILPFVTTGGDYAGRLSGFDTRGSDSTYLATDMAPFLLTLFPGVWALRAAGTSGRAFLFGLAIPFALGPFLSLTGDAYEIGSIVVTRLSPWSGDGLPSVLRGDDLFRRIPEVSAVGGLRPWLGVGCSTLLGTAWAVATYLAGAGVARLLGRGPVPPRTASTGEGSKPGRRSEAVS